MRENNWGPSRVPFHAARDPFRTTSFEEAVARLIFLAERQWPAGWLFGPSGCGKTAALQAVRRELRFSGREAILLSLCGLDGEEFWSTIATALDGRESQHGIAARKRVRALLAASSMIDRPVTFLLDDADRAEPSVWDQIAGLVRLAEGLSPQHTIIVATAGELPLGDFSRRIDLRADLRPFNADETANFLTNRLESAGCTVRFDSDAAAELFATTAGVPAAINRIADLALVAAAATGADRVTADDVRAVATDLRPAEDEPLITLPVSGRLARTA